MMGPCAVMVTVLPARTGWLLTNALSPGSTVCTGSLWPSFWPGTCGKLEPFVAAVVGWLRRSSAWMAASCSATWAFTQSRQRAEGLPLGKGNQGWKGSWHCSQVAAAGLGRSGLGSLIDVGASKRGGRFAHVDGGGAARAVFGGCPVGESRRFLRRGAAVDLPGAQDGPPILHGLAVHGEPVALPPAPSGLR